MIFSKTTPFILLLCLMLGGCASVSVSRQEWSDKVCVPDKILVRPFTVDRTKFRVDRDGVELDAFEQKFSAEFAERLAERLTKHVRPAMVISENEKVKDPKAWLIEGHFTRVHQGSRALRSLVGFGLGATKTEAQVDVFQVGAKGRLTRIAQLETTGGSNAEPGALFASPFGAVPRLITNVTTSGLAADARRTARTITAAVSEKLSAQDAQLAGRPLRAKRLGSLPSESDHSTR
jgi:hypothetical protein